ncbi:hypothetical protein [Agathobaculum butyriciproducens]|uniref:hypothetical protein n=1 Tax=Agathobaculum butyriciproducens TaxID=1628085 RepID=UPI0036D3AF7F
MLLADLKEHSEEYKKALPTSLLQKVSRAFFALNIGLDATANLQTIRSPKQERTKRLWYLLSFCYQTGNEVVKK